MMKDYGKIYLFFGITTILLFCVALINYLLFHITTELFTVFIGIMIFVIAVNSRVYVRRSSLLIIGIAYLFIGIIDIIHIFSVEGLGIINFSINQSDQFWVMARLMEATTLFFILAIPSLHLKIKHWTIYIIYFVFTALFIFVITTESYLVDFYIEGEGQTLARILFEIGIMMIFMITIVLVAKSKLSIQFKCIFCITIFLKVLSEFFFILQGGTMEIYGIFSHLFKYLSYGGIYIIYVSETIKAPYSNVFHLFKTKQLELMYRAETDILTGLCNHSTTYNKIEEAIKKIGQDYKNITLFILDIDDFKQINDTYGHIKGDEILQRIGHIFLTCEVDEKIAGRYGGDEFILVFPDCDKLEIIKRGNKLRKTINEMSLEIGIKVTCSMGVVIWEAGDNATDLIRKADTKMYESKRVEKGSLSIWEKEYTKRA